MKLVRNRTKFIKRYHDDLGFLRRVKLFTNTRLNIISNKIFLLKGEVNRLKSRRIDSNELKNGLMRRNSKNMYKLLKACYGLGSLIFKAKIKKTKINLKARQKQYLSKFLIKRIFRQIFKNIKERSLKQLYLKLKGDLKQMQIILETRIDMILVRSGLALDIDEARQLLNHKIVEINKQTVHTYSRVVKVGDLISLKGSYKRTQHILKRMANIKQEQQYIIEKQKQKKANFKARFSKSGWRIYKNKLIVKTYCPKVPNYLETNFPLFCTTLLYLPKRQELTYPHTLRFKDINFFLSGLKYLN